MWDSLIEVLVGLVIGGVTVYAASKIVKELWPRFVRLWEDFVAKIKEIFGYITEATKTFLAEVVKFLQDRWSELKPLLIKAFGYISEFIVYLFQQDKDIFLSFANPKNPEINNSLIGNIGEAPDNVQLPKETILEAKLRL